MFYNEPEGTGFEALDPRFGACIVGHARVERLWTGGRWLEGPAWFPAGRYLVCSDIPNNRMLRFDETDGSVSVFRQPSLNSNGNTVDREGRLISCEHLGRKVSRTEIDGSITVIADRYRGKRFNSPNDAVVKSDGSVWFTDPPYGILIDYEGGRAKSEIGANHVYRVDPNGTVSIAADDFDKPNGIAFSPDEKFLYVADTGASSGRVDPSTSAKSRFTARNWANPRFLLIALPECSMVSGWIARGASGPAPLTGCIAMRRAAS